MMKTLKLWITSLVLVMMASVTPSFAAYCEYPTTTVLTQNKATTEFGQSVTFTATVTSNYVDGKMAAGPSVTGDVLFKNLTTGATIGTVTLVAGVATIPTATLPVGANNIEAKYLGFGEGCEDTPKSSRHMYEQDYAESLDTEVHTVTAVEEPEPEPEPVNTASGALGVMQNSASAVAGAVTTELITDTVGDEVANALSGNVQLLSGGNGQASAVYSPGINPVADVPSDVSESSLRFWANLRYTNLSSTVLDGDHLNGLLGVTGIFGNGMVAGLVAGYENFDYEDAIGGILDGEGYSLGAYTGGDLGNGLRFDGQVHGAMIDYDVSNAGANGDFDATRLVVSGGFSHRTEFGNGLIIEPNLRATGTWEWQDGYTDSLAVAHAARDINYGRLSTGVKFSKNFITEGGTMTPFIGAAGEFRFSSGDIVGESILDGLSARLETGFDFTTNGGIGFGVHGELFGLGLDNNVIASSVKANLSVPF